jgi:hypothetical protein
LRFITIVKAHHPTTIPTTVVGSGTGALLANPLTPPAVSPKFAFQIS